MSTTDRSWPSLPLADWKATCDTLHMYTQILGKIRLMRAPEEPQWAHVALYVTARGLTTSPMPCDERMFQMDLDLIGHKLLIFVNDGQTRSIDLGASVAAFYGDVMRALETPRINVPINTKPQEVPDPIPFEQDTVHATYDRESVERFFQILSRADSIMKEHRAPFRGRHTPVHFFWGTFDLAYARFSGRPLTPPPGANLLMRVGGDAELIDAGFWPGDARFPEPAFFAYHYLKPDGLERAVVEPAQAFWSKELGEFILRYDDVRAAKSPRDALLAFFRSSYNAGVEAAHWDKVQ